MSILRLLADQMTVPEGQGERSPPYRMFIRDLVLLCRIGVYAHEKLRPQRVRINVSMRVEAEAAPRNDDIANVLSYDEVLGGIKRLAAGDRLAQICYKNQCIVIRSMRPAWTSSGYRRQPSEPRFDRRLMLAARSTLRCQDYWPTRSWTTFSGLTECAGTVLSDLVVARIRTTCLQACCGSRCLAA
jgi:hypothetical protein